MIFSTKKVLNFCLQTANGSESMRVSTQAWNEATDKAISNKRKEVVLPFKQYVLTFDEIVYSVDMPQVINHQTTC